MTEGDPSDRGGRLRAPMTVAIEHVVRDAREWRVARPTALFWFAFPVVLSTAVGLTILARPVYRFLISEDSLIEWLQVALLAGMAVFGVLVGVRQIRDRRRLIGLAYLAAAVVALFILGEEISWGQRILGWATPEELEDLNKQGETNVHNIGPALLFFHLGMLAVATLGTVLPIAWYRRAGGRARTTLEVLLVPPLFLVPAFVIPSIYRLFRFIFAPTTGFVLSRYQEVTELIFYVGLFLFVALVWRRLRAEALASEAPATGTPTTEAPR
jgi:hypothetical protein